MNKVFLFDQQIYKNMPVDATDVCIDTTGVYFYKIDPEQKMGQFKIPHCFNKVSNNWFALDLTYEQWNEFVKVRSIIKTTDFKHAYFKLWIKELFSKNNILSILKKAPVGATHFNFLSSCYHRAGPSDSEIYFSNSGWVGSAHCNTDLTEKFVSLDSLLSTVTSM